MALKKYNNPIISGRWSTKEPNNYNILALFGVSHKLMDDSKKAQDKSIKESTKVELVYTRYLTPWM